jgi:parvulin-like peptidyl-prolyl isomerase
MDRVLRWAAGSMLLAMMVMSQGCGNGSAAARDGTISAPDSRPLLPREPGPVEQSGAIYRKNQLPDRGATMPPPTNPLRTSPSIVPPVPATVPMPPVNPATTRPQATSIPIGQYMSLGSVLVQVNGKPIYADKVLQAVDADLAAKAREMDAHDFRRVAASEIETEIISQIRSELQYAAAMDALTPEEKSMADTITMQWQQKQIAYAGGSIEEAKRRAAAEGYPFDQQVADQNRTIVNLMYFEKKIRPRVQVSPAEMRKYYDDHINSFSERAQAQFRVIKFDFKKIGSKEEARKLAQQTLQSARAGEDFASLAAKYNSDDYLARQKGDVGWVERGAYANEKLEQAVWKIKPGQITDIVETPDAFYIAKLENLKTDNTKSFDDPDVQEAIHKTLFEAQAREMRERDYQRLKAEAMIVPDVEPRQFVEPVLEMAMQKYPVWRGSGSK